MDCNKVPKLDDLPNVKRKIGEYYLIYIKQMRQAVYEIIGRHLNSQEKERLRKYSFKMAYESVAIKFRDNCGLSKEELTDMYESMTQAQLSQMMDTSLASMEDIE